MVLTNLGSWVGDVCWKSCSSCWSLYPLREEFLSAPIHSPPPSLVRRFGPSKHIMLSSNNDTSTVIYDEGKQDLFTQTRLNHKSSKPSPRSNILFLNRFKGNNVWMRKQIDGFNIWSKKYPDYLYIGLVGRTTQISLCCRESTSQKCFFHSIIQGMLKLQRLLWIRNLA
jgi:hypothetical protein